MQQTGNNPTAAPILRIESNHIHLALPQNNTTDNSQQPTTYTCISLSIQADGQLKQQLTDLLLKYEEPIVQTHQPLLVLIDSPYILIPANEYDAQQAEQIYRYAVTDNNDPMAEPLYLHMLSTYVLFTVPKDISDVLQQHAPTVKYQPSAAPLWTHLRQQQTANSPVTLYAYLHDDSLEVFAFNGTRFRFANRFTAKHPNDILYYILFVWEQTGMNAEQDNLTLYGNIPQKEWLNDRLKTFLRHVHAHSDETLYQFIGNTTNN